jgi:hypothetical protein
MKQRVFNVLVALSSLLLAVVGVMWARSYTAPTERRSAVSAVTWEVRSAGGTLFVERDNPTVRNYVGQWALIAGGDTWKIGPRFLRLERMEILAFQPLPGESKAKLPRESSRLTHDSTDWRLWCDYWLLALLTALLPALWLVARVRGRARRRRAAGLCPVCGYDLRATPGICPECGSASVMKQRLS